MSYYASMITLTWQDSCTNKWKFSTSTSYHPKFEWATLPSFRHFRHLHSSWKAFDSGIRMQGYCLVQCSGVHQQVLADQWSVQTIWIARWKGIDNLNIFEHRPGSFGRVFNTFQRACEIWYRLIMMNRWAIMYPSSPWRGETAASRDGNFRRVPCFIQSSNVQHSQVSVTFVTFTHPERVLILGSGCKDTALYNVQGSISRSWQMSGQCKQSASRGENRPGSFGRIFNTWERVFVRYDIDDLLCIHHHLDVARQLHQNMTILDEYLVSSKVRMSNTPKFPSLSSPSLILKGFWFWDQDARILPCTMFRGPSAGPGRWVVSANNLHREVKIGRDLSEESSTPGKGFLWDMISMIYDVSIITLTWQDSCIKRWQFWTSTSYHPKFEWATLPSFRHFRHLHSSWKGFDSGIRMQGYCLVQCSGVHQQVLADEWSVQTICIARWK